MRKKIERIQGTYQASPKGFGFVIPDAADGGGDWFVPRGGSGGAWDGDSVTLTPTDPARRAGRISAVTRRANPVVTGVLHREGRSYFLTPDRERLTHAILLTGKVKGVSPGLQAAVEVVNYGTPTTPAMGALREVFGPGGTRQAAQAAILYHYDVSETFPPEVEEAARALPQTVSEGELAGRRDFRGETIVTIDSASAKDLDDAVSLTRDPQGRRVLGVHIADVSHYVAAQSPIDREAYGRGTSVYYADRVAPMLPVALSNGICSLNPQVDRLTLSCLMTLDEAGNVVAHELCQGVIRTADRLNYAEVNALLAGETPPPGPLSEGAPHARAIRELVRGLDALAAQRRRLRRLRGALELTSTECCFIMGPDGRVADVQKRESGPGESLIEECMLLANETVAAHLGERGLPGVYRVHETPSQDKTQGLKRMVAPLGYDLREGDGFHLQKLLAHFKGGPLEGAVNMMVLRSLMKARYDPQDLGHFGLAAAHYCHFTSPIRRYPDLVVHRILTASLQGRSLKALRGFAASAAAQSSERELAAVNAEREIEKLYLAEFMQAHLGETFPGAITGVNRFGVFVGLENGVEGLLPLEALPTDRYDYDEDALILRGQSRGHTYSFGMPLEVTAAAADPSTGKIDFVLPSSQEPAPRPDPAPAPRRPRPPRPSRPRSSRRPHPRRRR